MSEMKPNDLAPIEDVVEERPPKPQYAVTIAVSPRTLFNMVAERKIYDDEGVEKYVAYQEKHEHEPLKPGAAFPFVKALMDVNCRLRKLYPDSEELFDIILMTNNHAQVGVRLINSINHYDLTIERFCMTGGKSLIGYLKAYMTDLYLSKDSEKVTEAIEEGIAAATMFTQDMDSELSNTELRVAFDGDAVLFSDESEIIYKEQGLDAFNKNEKDLVDDPLAQGPLKCFLEALGKLQRKFYDKNERMNCPIRTYLVTSRGAASSGARVLKTLRSWGLEIDEASVAALMDVNCRLRKLYPDSEELFDIILMTNNHAQVGVRLINSINHYDLTIERFCMTGGKSLIGYLKAYMTDLYLSKDSEKVTEAIEEGIAAATMFTQDMDSELSNTELRVAFDGDAVLFSDESEIIYKEQGLDAFNKNEKDLVDDPLAQGPLKCFLEALGKLQRKFYDKNERMNCPIRTYLVTSRGAASSGARVLKTLRSWGLEIDEALFLAGAPKGPLLKMIKPHIFFDDQMSHIEGAKEMGTISAHVPYGIGQKYHKGKLIEQPAKKP